MSEVEDLKSQIEAIQSYSVKREVKLNLSYKNYQQEPSIFGVQGAFSRLTTQIIERPLV